MKQDSKVVVSKEAVFQALQLLRKKIQPDFSDWKDADDWLFSELDFTREELERIYTGSAEQVYFGSAVAEGETYFGSIRLNDDMGCVQISGSLRSKYGIETGTPLMEIPTEEGILLVPYKPINPHKK